MCIHMMDEGDVSYLPHEGEKDGGGGGWDEWRRG